MDIFDKSDATTDPRSMPEVMDRLRHGRTIHAIKRYREITGAGLREAKDAVDRVLAQGL